MRVASLGLERMGAPMADHVLSGAEAAAAAADASSGQDYAVMTAHVADRRVSP